MTKHEFQELTQNIVLLDGATGSNLMAAGMPKGVCTEEWVLAHKDVIQNLQRAYIEAGSNIIYAPTFGGNRVSLTMHGLQDRMEEINRTLVSYSREVADAADHKVYVAADITTSGKMMAPAGEMTYEAAFEMYQEQIGILKDSGVDLIVAETMINIEETLAAVDAASTVCELPIMCTMTVDADGSIFSADAVGVNCSVGPDQLVSVIRNIKENVSIPVIAKPNAGMPFIDDNGNAVYSMKAPDFARHVKALIDAGAGIVGGCCGTTPEYIREVAKMIGR